MARVIESERDWHTLGEFVLVPCTSPSISPPLVRLQTTHSPETPLISMAYSRSVSSLESRLTIVR